MRRKRVLVGVLLLFVGSWLVQPPGVAGALVEPSSTGPTDRLDKTRCQATYEAGSLGQDTIRLRCYVDRDYASSWLILDRGTRRSVPYNTAPYYMSVPGPWNQPNILVPNCTIGAGNDIDVAVGPGVVGPSGDMLEDLQVEILYHVRPVTGTGTGCRTGAGQTQANGWNNSLWSVGPSGSRSGISYPSPGGSPRCNGPAADPDLCLLVAGSGWPAWGAAEFPSILPFCGATVVMTGPEPELITPAPTSRLIAGADYRFQTVWTSNRTGEVWVQFPSWASSDRWYPIHVPGSLTQPSVAVVEADIFPGAQLLVSGVRYRCRDVLDDELHYFNQGQYTDFVPTDGRPRACTFVNMTWPPQQRVAVDDEFTWSVEFASGLPTVGDDTVDIQSVQADPALGVSPYDAYTWTPVVTDLVQLETDSFDLVAEFAGDMSMFLFRCVDASGPYYAREMFYGYSTSLVDVGSEESCWQALEFGDSFSSVARGLLRGIGCALGEVFIPSPSAVNALWDDAAELADKAPVSFIAELHEAVTGPLEGAESAAVAATGDCLVVLGEGPDGLWDEGEVCPSDLSAVTNVSTVRVWTGRAFWLLSALVLLLATRRIWAGA